MIMTQDQFKKELDKCCYSYYEEDGWIIVDHDHKKENPFYGGSGLCLVTLTSLPEKVVFNNSLNLYLTSLEEMPKNVKFDNEGIVDLISLKTIHYKSLINNKDKFKCGKNVYYKNGKELARTNAEVVFD